MIVCAKCGRENQDDYRFCLGCGNDLSMQIEKQAAQSSPGQDHVEDPAYYASTQPATSPQNIGEAPTMAPTGGGASMMGPSPQFGPPPAASSASASSPSGTAACPSCGTENPASFMFCGNCGSRISQSAQHAMPAVDSSPDQAVGSQPHVQSATTVARLALIRPDGSEGGNFDVAEADVVIGRASGQLFEHDTYMSPNHTRMVFADDHVILEDAGSLNGVFVRIVDQEPLYDGDVFRIGQELLRFDVIKEPALTEDGTEVLGSPNPGYWGRLTLLVGKQEEGSAFPLMGEEMVMGRERGDILFSDDGYVSGAHAKIALDEEGHVFLVDLGSSNGTFIRLREPRGVPYGTLLLMGQQLFRVDPA